MGFENTFWARKKGGQTSVGQMGGIQYSIALKVGEPIVIG